VAKALSPAQVIEVRIDEEHRIANVVVPERMLSLAIGREGQNARLAAKLTGWRIDIRSDVSVAEAAREAAIAAAELPAEAVQGADTEESGGAAAGVEAAEAEPKTPAKPKRRKAAAESATETHAKADVEPASKKAAKPRSRKAAPKSEADEAAAEPASAPEEVAP
jgi:hypothetical protein